MSDTVKKSVEILEDIPGAVHLEPLYGSRFKSYYLFKKVLDTFHMINGLDGSVFLLPAYIFEVRFIMPPHIKFPGGIISYSLAEREFGVFRFPRDQFGDFVSPIAVHINLNELNNITQQEIETLLTRPQPLVFDAYKIPYHGFEFVDLSECKLNEIETVCGLDYATRVKHDYDEKYEQLMKIILDKINRMSDYLLILENILYRYRINLDEVVKETDGIIHI